MRIGQSKTKQCRAAQGKVNQRKQGQCKKVKAKQDRVAQRAGQGWAAKNN